MEHLALYRKYRPKDLCDVVGQKNIIKILTNEIKMNKISHAYLFSGPRGTGKTTTAKIFGNLINCQNLVDGKLCGSCEWCLHDNNIDIIEIDAASNNGVEEIREIKDKVSLMPNMGKYKVYIIDEVHMLTIQAFNALLKTLEEPPKHIVFILATTDLHKVPLTISSRCQKFNFNNINIEDIVFRLNFIANEEKIKISRAGLYEIASLSNGGLRDAINLLDQISVYDYELITDKEVDEVSDYVNYEDIYDIISCINLNNKKELIKILDRLEDENLNVKVLFFRISDVFKDMLLKKNNISINFNNYSNIKIKIIEEFYKQFTENQIIKIIKNLTDKSVLSYNDSFSTILLVTTLFSIINELCQNEIQNEETTEVKPSDKNATCNISSNLLDKKNNNEQENLKLINQNLNKIKMIRINNTFVSASKEKLKKFLEKWKLLNKENIIDNYNEEILMLKDCLPVLVGDNNIIILSKFESVSKKINNYQENIEKLLEKIYNSKYKIISLTNLEWEEEKRKYIQNLKAGYKYHYIEEENSICEVYDYNDSSNSLNNLIDIVGKEIIEYSLEEK